MLLVDGLLIAACGGSATDSSEEEEGSDSDDESTELTLSSCTTDISADLPAFYTTYFKCVSMDLEGGSVVIDANGLPPLGAGGGGAG